MNGKSGEREIENEGKPGIAWTNEVSSKSSMSETAKRLLEYIFRNFHTYVSVLWRK